MTAHNFTHEGPWAVIDRPYNFPVRSSNSLLYDCEKIGLSVLERGTINEKRSKEFVGIHRSFGNRCRR
jgi:hypothetical protein